MRPTHYIKNLIIFVPAVFAGAVFNHEIFAKVFWGFTAFCFISSAVYIINDIFDADIDRRHEVKAKRPVANGAVKAKNALFLTVALLVFGVAASALAAPGPASLLILVSYLVLNILYSAYLKNVPVLDLVILASGFVLRVVYGGLIAGAAISDWLYLVIIMFSFFIGLGKRRAEILSGAQEARGVLKYYTKEFLGSNMYACMTLSVVFYAMWCLDHTTVAAKKAVLNLIFTVPLVLVIFMCYSMRLESAACGDPVDIVLKDKPLLLLILLYAGFILFIFFPRAL
jgi:4-hydroxybenzoate polyprenyltransferase